MTNTDCYDHSDSVTREEFVIGKTRIRDGTGFTGTIVFVGPVASAKDQSTIYAGIVWDDGTRGIHDGSVLCRKTKQVVRHFQAPYPTAGSFVKVSVLDTGRKWTPSMTVRERYVSLDSDERVAPGDVFPDHKACTASGRDDKVIEFLGELKIRSQQQVEDLRAISLRRSGLNSVDVSLDWSNLEHLQELDLAGNLLADWKPVLDIISLFPSLVKLSVAGNRIGDFEYEIPDILSTKLEHLNLNDVKIRNVNTIMQIGKMLPCLRELIIANNKDSYDSSMYCYSSRNKLTTNTSSENSKNDRADAMVSKLRDAFPNLVYLDCSNCSTNPSSSNNEPEEVLHSTNSVYEYDDSGLFNPNDIFAIWSRLPTLQSLSLDDNPIRDFSIPWKENDRTNPCFPHLQHIQLSGTNIKDWSDIDILRDSLPELISLRLRNCPLLKSDHKQSFSDNANRTLLISRLPKLHILNGSIVTEMEQREAARWYIRNVIRNRADNNTEESNNESKALFDYWVGKYPEILARGKGLGGSERLGDDATLADSVLNVTLRSMAAGSCTMEPLIRRLPSTLTVGRLKALCARQFGLDIDLQCLQYVVMSSEGKMCAFPTPLDQGDDSTLEYYGIPSDGAEILVNEIDIERTIVQKEQEKNKLEESIKQQERQAIEFQTIQREQQRR